MEGLNTHPDDSLKISRSKKLRLFTKMLREPVTVSGSAYRSGAHPVLAVRVASEVTRSPKVGLVQTLMREGREAFESRDFPKAIVKSLAAEELLRKYGGILAPDKATDIKDQLQFLKIQYFLLSGQAGEAFRVLKEQRNRFHPYLWHRKMAQRSGLTAEHWRMVEMSLRQFFQTSHSGKIFCLLGYVIALGPEPNRVKTLAEDLNYTPTTADKLYMSIVRDYESVASSSGPRERNLLPIRFASERALTPLFRLGDTCYVGTGREINASEFAEIEKRTKLETVVIPMPTGTVRELNAS